MLLGTVHFIVRKNATLYERLQSAPDWTVGALEDDVAIPIQAGADPIHEDVMSGVKILFVASILYSKLPADDVALVFGSLRPTVPDFDRWWTCEAVVAELSLEGLVADLRAANALDSLDPVATRLLGHVV